MGENPIIIIIPETGVHDRESREWVFRNSDCESTAGGLERSAGGVARRRRTGRSGSAEVLGRRARLGAEVSGKKNRRILAEGDRSARWWREREVFEWENKDSVRESAKWRRDSESRGRRGGLIVGSFIDSLPASRLSHRLVLILSLLGLARTPSYSSFSRSSPSPSSSSSSVSTSRGPPLRRDCCTSSSSATTSSSSATTSARSGNSSVNSSRGSSCCFAFLVSLLLVGLLKPSLAVPTSNNFALAGLTSAVGAASAGSATTNSHYVDTTLRRIMPLQRERASLTEKAAQEKEPANSEGLVEATMNRRRRRLGLENHPTNEYEYYDEEDDDDDDDDLHDDEDHHSPLHSTPLLQHPRESGLERRSRLPEAELDTIRRSIVEGLGLERIPDPSKANVSQAEYRRAHEEYLNRLRSRASEDDRSRRLHTFHLAERQPPANRTRRAASTDPEDPNVLVQPEALYFPLAIPDEDALVDHATLRLLVDPSGTRLEEEAHLASLYRLTADSRHLVSRRKLPAIRRGARWIEVEATELASLWHDYGVENLGLEVRFERSDGIRVEEQPRISEAALNVFTVAIDLEENPGYTTRRKRRASPEHLMSLHKGRRTECRGENKKCCRHQMTVIFKDLKGFEFIVQPKNFDAGYCKGRCPPRYNPAHHHALLQSLIWKEGKYRERKVPRPCCAPSKLDELEILYFDENDPTKLKVSTWKNMKVLECACS